MLRAQKISIGLFLNMHTLKGSEFSGKTTARITHN